MTTESPYEPLHGKPYEIGFVLHNPSISVVHFNQYMKGV